MILKIGTMVVHQDLDGNKHIASIQGIEICKDGEKHGKPVTEVDTADYKNKRRIVIDLSDNSWCYGSQIVKILK